jgi:phospholipid/cholesterol/gamma-HCH transport system ATP-binding protein
VTDVYDLVDVWKSFDSHVVLRGIHLSLQRGETLGLIGPSGSGKSVLLKCMIALFPIDRGELRFLGLSLPDMNRDERMRLRQRVGFQFQSGALFDSLTVQENVEYALHEHFFRSMSQREMRDRVGWALDAVGLSRSEAPALPRDLSGGMQKRLGIARTIVTQPEVVLYDSPTDGLDPQNAHRISDLIAELHEKLGVTSIVASHDLRTVYTICNRVSFIEAGEIVETRTPEELVLSEHESVRDFVIGHPPEEPLDPRESQPPEPWPKD